MDPTSGHLAAELANRGIQVEGLIYQTSESRVYKAIDRHLNCYVALKLIQNSMAVDQARAMEEVRIQATFRHSNVVQLYNYFTCAGTQNTWILALEVELMDIDLLHDINNRFTNNYPYTETEIFDFLFAISHALAEAQQQGIAHRDIKPQNIFVKQGVYKLGDFGSASQHFDSSISLTVVGTLIFLSPLLRKALMMRENKTTHNPYKSDVYSLGLTIVYMALGQLMIEDFLGQAQRISYSDWMKQVVFWMLAEEERDRPDFVTLYTYLHSQKYAVESPVYAQSEEVSEEVQVIQSESRAAPVPIQPESPAAEVCIVCDEAIHDPLTAIREEGSAMHKECLFEQWKTEEAQKKEKGILWGKVAAVSALAGSLTSTILPNLLPS